MKTLKGLVLISALVAGGVLSACSNTPGASASLPAVSLPAVSIDPSAATSAVVAALDQIKTEIGANQSDTGLTTEDARRPQGLRRADPDHGRDRRRSAASPRSTSEGEGDRARSEARDGAGARLKAVLTQLETLLSN